MYDRRASAVRTVEAIDRLDAVRADAAATQITVCFPCRNEAATIGALVAGARQSLLERGLIDELVVIDDRSTDGTARIAADAGARVVDIDEVHARYGPGEGKGNVLWASLLATHGDVVVWCDGDVTSFSPDWIARLAAPLVCDPELHLVKAMYRRPTTAGGGGRTTELVARPLLSMYAPELAALAQPLSGEFAGRRAALEQIPFVQGWGVEIAMLIDLAQRFGAGTLAQVDLGVRHHRHRDLHALATQAAEVMATALGRLAPEAPIVSPVLTRADGSQVPLRLDERPPIAMLRALDAGGGRVTSEAIA